MKSRRKLSAILMLLAGTIGGVASCHGCGSEGAGSAGSAPLPDGGGGGSTLPDVIVDAVSDEATNEGPTDVVTEPPDGIPPGWELWTGWSAACPLYVPGAGAEMPPPIEWEPCPPPVPQHLACRRMIHTWGSPGWIAFYPRFSLDSESGAPVLQFSRAAVGGDRSVRYHLVAEADGPVRSAILNMNAWSFDCQYFDEDLADERYVIAPNTETGAAGPDGKRGLEEGVIGGGIDERVPTVLVKQDANPDLISNWSISKDWIVQRKGVRKAWTWDGQSSTMIYEPSLDPDHLPGLLPVVRGKDVFMMVGGLQRCGVMSWNPTEGLRPLLRWYGDTTRGAGNFGTDGVDMVWTYSEGMNACSTPPNPEVWTAPYTLDPAQVQATARRVRRDVGGPTTKPFAVGYGHAARTTSFGVPLTNGLSIVRLSDGISWAIPGDPTGDPLSWGNALGFTAEELFVVASMQDTSVTIIRIRLDSLGPGTPPD